MNDIGIKGILHRTRKLFPGAQVSQGMGRLLRCMVERLFYGLLDHHVSKTFVRELHLDPMEEEGDIRDAALSQLLH